MEEVEGPMPGTSRFLGQWEWDPAHVGVVVRLGTVEHVFQGPGWGGGRSLSWVGAYMGPDLASS